MEWLIITLFDFDELKAFEYILCCTNEFILVFQANICEFLFKCLEPWFKVIWLSVKLNLNQSLKLESTPEDYESTPCVSKILAQARVDSGTLRVDSDWEQTERQKEEFQTLSASWLQKVSSRLRCLPSRLPTDPSRLQRVIDRKTERWILDPVTESTPEGYELTPIFGELTPSYVRVDSQRKASPKGREPFSETLWTSRLQEFQSRPPSQPSWLQQDTSRLRASSVQKIENQFFGLWEWDVSRRSRVASQDSRVDFKKTRVDSRKKNRKMGFWNPENEPTPKCPSHLQKLASRLQFGPSQLQDGTSTLIQILNSGRVVSCKERVDSSNSRVDFRSHESTPISTDILSGCADGAERLQITLNG